MHCVSQQGEGIYVIKPAVPSRNLWGGDPVRQLLPRLSPLDSPVVTTQFGGHFQAVVRKYNSVTGRRGVTSEQVHVMPIHGHHQVPEGPLISNSADSGFFLFSCFRRNSGPQSPSDHDHHTRLSQVLQSYNIRSRHLSLAWAGLSPRQSAAQRCWLFRGDTRVIVDNGCRHTGYAGGGRLPTCSGSHTNERCTYRESCKSGKSNTGLFCLLGMTPEFRPVSVSFVKRREHVSSSVQKG